MMTSFPAIHLVQQNRDYGYNGRIHNIREKEYPYLGSCYFLVHWLTLDTIYLDHAGATPYPVSIIREYSEDLVTHLHSNPHSHSASSIATANRILSIRLRVLKLLKASPKHFDVVFVANATAFSIGMGCKVTTQFPRLVFTSGCRLVSDYHTARFLRCHGSTRLHCLIVLQDLWLSRSRRHNRSAGRGPYADTKTLFWRWYS